MIDAAIDIKEFDSRLQCQSLWFLCLHNASQQEQDFNSGLHIFKVNAVSEDCVSGQQVPTVQRRENQASEATPAPDPAAKRPKVGWKEYDRAAGEPGPGDEWR